MVLIRFYIVDRTWYNIIFIGNEPIKAFEEIDLIYKEMHTNYKLSSLYMEHYSFHPRSIQVITRDQLKQYNHWLHHQAEQAGSDILNYTVGVGSRGSIFSHDVLRVTITLSLIGRHWDTSL